MQKVSQPGDFLHSYESLLPQAHADSCNKNSTFSLHI
jgi:hypothetical protein